MPPVGNAVGGLFFCGEAMCGDGAMLRLAFFVSVVFHLAVLLSWRQQVLLSEPAGHSISRMPNISANLVSRREESAVPSPPSPIPVPEFRTEVLPTEVLVQTGSDPRRSVFGTFSPSTATDDIAVTEKSSARHADPVAPPSTASTQHEDPSPDGLRQYRLNLAREARRFKHFPQLARDRGWEGAVVVVVSTVAGMPVPQVSLSNSSGYELLDREALELVAQAINTAALPESLHNRPFALTLPIHYRLDD